MVLCAYSDIFGKPNTGLHEFRLFNLALIDIIFTLIFAYVFYYILNSIYGYQINYFLVLIILFIISIVLHRLFCVKTTVDNFLFN